MLNLLKMDIYRTLRQRSFYVSLAIVLFIYFMMLNGSGLTSNTPFANWDREANTMVEFLFYFPKSIFFSCGTLVFLALFVVAEYDSGYAKNIYPIKQQKLTLIVERYLFSMFIFLVFFLTVIVVVLLSNVWIQDSFTGFQFFDFLLYSLTQMLVLSCVSSFIMMMTHLFQSKVLSTLIAFGYSCMIFFMIHAMLNTFLPTSLSYLENTLYYRSGILPIVFEVEGYAQTLGLVILQTILYNGIAYYVVNKKDLK